MEKRYITVNGKRRAVWFSMWSTGELWLIFAGEEHGHRAHRDGYAYTHGGTLYRAAVDRAVELGMMG